VAALYRGSDSIPNSRRLQAYSDTLARVYRDFSGDAEVAIYYALSLVATAPKIDQVSYFERTASPNARSMADAQDLALWTGGTLLWASSAIDAAFASRQILTEIRHQYLIAVDSAGEGVWRRLDVRVRDSRMTVRARSGYFGRDAGPGR